MKPGPAAFVMLPRPKSNARGSGPVVSGPDKDSGSERRRSAVACAIVNELGHDRSRRRRRGLSVQKWRKRVENVSSATWPTPLSLAFNLDYLDGLTS